MRACYHTLQSVNDCADVIFWTSVRELIEDLLLPEALRVHHELEWFTGGSSVTIKSHHKVGGLPERMNMKLVEPLAFKIISVRCVTCVTCS
jgi:hypothetical protein